MRDLAPQVLGSLIRRYRDFSAAEDAVQEALLAAAKQWPADGMPENPKAWLIHVASRRMTDQIRSEVARRKRETESAMASGYEMPAMPTDADGEDDDTLVLMYMCCHPELGNASAIALTLRAVGGLTTAEIARVPGAGSNHGAAHQPRQADDQRFRCTVPTARTARPSRAASSGAPCALSDL